MSGSSVSEFSVSQGLTLKPQEILRVIVEGLILALGLLIFAMTGRSIRRSHQALIKLFCLTSGRSNDALAGLVSNWEAGSLKRLNPTLEGCSVFGVEWKENAPALLEQLNENGFCVVEAPLGNELIEQLFQVGITQKGHWRLSTKQIKAQTTVENEGAFDRLKPRSPRFEFSQQLLVESEAAQKIISDPGLIYIAANYLRAVPKLDLVAMWWHTTYSDFPDPEAAQLYHFDMDRIRWLKFFFYLTDVNLENGPHCFVSGTHKSFKIPRSFLERGYARIEDHEVETAYTENDRKVFTGARGKIIIEDTRGLHKGRHVEKGDRLMLQIQFSNSLFGASYSSTKLPKKITPDLQRMLELYPTVYKIFQ